MQSLKLFFALALVCTVFAIPTHKCTDEEFDCGDTGRSCIPIEWVCDNVKDCMHGKDEAQCNYLHQCPEGDFMCHTAECVSFTSKCNGIVECADGSDEVACTANTSTTTPPAEPVTSSSAPDQPAPAKSVCTDDEFSCHAGDKACVPIEWVCDNVKDCTDGSDEGSDCHYLHACFEGEFMCRSGDCVAAILKCNGVNDCSDGSDEISCVNITLSSSVTVEPSPAIHASNQSSSSAWKTFFILFFLMLLVSAVIIYFVLRNYPEFVDRMQNRVAFSRKPTTYTNVNLEVKG